MWKHIAIGIITATSLFYLSVAYWLDTPAHVQVNPCTIDDLVDNREDMERVIRKMGPYHSYKITVNGNLYVKVGENDWMRLKYKNRKECPAVGKVP